MLDLSNLTNEEVYSLLLATHDRGPDEVRELVVTEFYKRANLNNAPVTSETTPPLLRSVLPQPFAGEQARGAGEDRPSKHEPTCLPLFIVAWILILICGFAAYELSKLPIFN